MQENVRRFIRHDVIDTKFQQSARQQPSLGNMPLVVFFFLPHVQNHKRLSSLDFRLDQLGC